MTPLTPTTPAASAPQRGWIGGVVLIAIGVFLLLAQFVPENMGWIALAALSLLFIAVYMATRKGGWMIPAMILGGLAIGVGLQEYGYDLNDSIVVLGLAAGFIAIYVFNSLTGAPAQWWPLVPGGILAAVGLTQALGNTVAGDVIQQWWPLALIALGVLVLFTGRDQLFSSRSKT